MLPLLILVVIDVTHCGDGYILKTDRETPTGTAPLCSITAVTVLHLQWSWVKHNISPLTRVGVNSIPIQTGNKWKVQSLPVTITVFSPLIPHWVIDCHALGTISLLTMIGWCLLTAPTSRIPVIAVVFLGTGQWDRRRCWKTSFICATTTVTSQPEPELLLFVVLPLVIPL